jgi:hypothetical protein
MLLVVGSLSSVKAGSLCAGAGALLSSVPEQVPFTLLHAPSQESYVVLGEGLSYVPGQGRGPLLCCSMVGALSSAV